MRKVTVKQDELLKILQENRSVHKADYEDAYKGYLETCAETLEKMLAEINAGDRETVQWTEYPPQNQVKDYDRVIRMLELSVDDEIELSAEEFSNFVQDDWQWKDSWAVSNSHYITKTRGV